MSLNVAVSQALLDEMALTPVERRGDEFHCPLRTAIIRELGTKARFIEVTVWHDEIRLRNWRYDETYVNPEWVRQWIAKWDSGVAVQPIGIEYKDGKMYDRVDWSRSSRSAAPCEISLTKLD